MSIFIKNVEMPACCDKCFALDDHGDYPYCLITGDWRGYKFRTREKRMDTCPLIKVESIRHGKWIRDEFGTRCSNCGLYAYRDKFDKPWESPYCPNCGAKMDGERK